MGFPCSSKSWDAMELHRAGSGEPKRQTGAPEGVGQIQGVAHENSALCVVGSKLVCRFLVELKNHNGTETLELCNPAVLLLQCPFNKTQFLQNMLGDLNIITTAPCLPTNAVFKTKYPSE